MEYFKFLDREWKVESCGGDSKFLSNSKVSKKNLISRLLKI